MKKTAISKMEATSGEMRAEYSFAGGIKNPYAERYAKGTNLVLIEPELSVAFPGEKEVNEALRLLLKAGTQAVRVKEKARKAS